MIPRTAAMQTALQDPTATRCWLINMEFESGNDRITTYPHALDWNGFTWSSLAVVTELGSYKRSASSLLQEFGIVLGAGPRHPTRVFDILQEARGRNFKLYLAIIDAAGTGVITNPVQFLSRRMQPGLTRSSGAGYSIQVAAESVFNRSRVRAPRTVSHQQQQLVDPTDDCLVDMGKIPLGNTQTTYVFKSGFPGV